MASGTGAFTCARSFRRAPISRNDRNFNTLRYSASSSELPSRFQQQAHAPQIRQILASSPRSTISTTAHAGKNVGSQRYRRLERPIRCSPTNYSARASFHTFRSRSNAVTNESSPDAQEISGDMHLLKPTNTRAASKTKLYFDESDMAKIKVFERWYKDQNWEMKTTFSAGPDMGYTCDAILSGPIIETKMVAAWGPSEVCLFSALEVSGMCL